MAGKLCIRGCLVWLGPLLSCVLIGSSSGSYNFDVVIAINQTASLFFLRLPRVSWFLVLAFISREELSVFLMDGERSIIVIVLQDSDSDRAATGEKNWVGLSEGAKSFIRKPVDGNGMELGWKGKAFGIWQSAFLRSHVHMVGVVLSDIEAKQSILWPGDVVEHQSVGRSVGGELN